MFRILRTNPYPIVILSLLIAIVLNVIKYPYWMIYAKPDWVLLVLFYWCLVIPQRISLGWGWTIGLFTDVTYYSLLGQNAMAKTVVAWIANMVGNKARLTSLWQQCILVFFVASIDITITASINSIIHKSDIHIVYWQSAITTCFIWPVVHIVLCRIKTTTIDRD